MTLSSVDRALVTGASSGIGEATVRALRELGVTVYAAARRMDRLEALAEETGCIPHPLDVRDRTAVDHLADLEVDILVNNAGLGRAMKNLFDGSVDDIERTIDTNVTAAIQVVHAVVPGMVERGKGHVVNMSSVAALGPAGSSLYGASKAAIHMFCRNLRLELRGTGIRVTELCPGRVSTEFFDVAVDDGDLRASLTATAGQELSPADIADAVIYVCSAPWHVNVSLIEIFPTEQTYGGSQFVPYERRGGEPTS